MSKIELIERNAPEGLFRLTPLNQVENPELMGAGALATCVLTSIAPALLQPGLYGLEGVPSELLEVNGPEKALARTAEQQKRAWAEPEDLAAFLNVDDASDLMRYVGRANSTNCMQYFAPRGYLAANSSAWKVRDLKSGKDWNPGPAPDESYLYSSGSSPSTFTNVPTDRIRLLENGSSDPGYVRDVFVDLESTRGPADVITFLAALTGAGHQVLVLDVTSEGVVVGDSAGFPNGPARGGFQWLNSREQPNGCVYMASWDVLASWLATSRIHVLRFE